MKRFFLFILLFTAVCFISSSLISKETKDKELQKLLLLQEGFLPLVISIPHGGRLHPKGWVPRKKRKGIYQFRNQRDTNTLEIGKDLAQRIGKLTGKKPYLVASLVHRKFVDFNRKEREGTQDSKSRRIHRLYYQTLEKYLHQCVKRFGFALLIDIHGQKTYSPHVILGTRKGKSLDPELRRGLPPLYLLQEWQKRFKASGFICSSGKSTFSGGNIVKSFGGQKCISAVQVEIHKNIRFNPRRSKLFIHSFSRILVLFLKKMEKIYSRKKSYQRKGK